MRPFDLPLGYKYATHYAGIRKQEKDDLALIVSGVPAAAAAVFTTNRVQAAPVRLARTNMRASKGVCGAILVNAGNANCATKTGDKVAANTTKALAKLLKLQPSQVLPASTGERKARDVSKGRQDGRGVEIQRLIGRSLRVVVDFKALGERSVYVDCDVLQADGGTRCAAITGGYVALRLALQKLVDAGELETMPLTGSVAAISVGIVDGRPLCDLDYSEDSTAEVDANVVMTGEGGLVEVQATAERTPLSRASLDELLGLAEMGISRLRQVQERVVGGG